MFKNEQVFDFNSKKISNILNIDVKLDKMLKNNQIKQNKLPKLKNNDFYKDLDLKIDTKNNKEINFQEGPEKVKSALNSNTLPQNNNTIKNFETKENLDKIFSKINYLKEDINSNN